MTVAPVTWGLTIEFGIIRDACLPCARGAERSPAHVPTRRVHLLPIRQAPALLRRVGDVSARLDDARQGDGRAGRADRRPGGVLPGRQPDHLRRARQTLRAE